MAFLARDDFQLHYAFDDDGGNPDREVVLLANSLGTTMDLWDPQLTALRTRFRVLRYDQRGHGGSGVPSGAYTMSQLGEDAVALMDALHIGSAHFCGISIGGMTAMWTAIHHPQRIRRLALCNTAAYIGPPDMWAARISALERGTLAPLADGILARWFTPAFLEQAPASIQVVRDQLIATDPQGYAGCCAAIRDADLREAIGSITAPTLVLSGTRDLATPAGDGRFIATHIAGASFHAVDAAHLSNIEAAGPFTAHLMHFLAEGLNDG